MKENRIPLDKVSRLALINSLRELIRAKVIIAALSSEGTHAISYSSYTSQHNDWALNRQVAMSDRNIEDGWLDIYIFLVALAIWNHSNICKIP